MGGNILHIETKREKQMSQKEKTHQQACLSVSTHELLQQIIDNGFVHVSDGFISAKKPSKASIIHELVLQLHKKEFKK